MNTIGAVVLICYFVLLGFIIWLYAKYQGRDLPTYSTNLFKPTVWKSAKKTTIVKYADGKTVTTVSTEPDESLEKEIKDLEEEFGKIFDRKKFH